MITRGLRPMLGGAAIVAATGFLAGGLALRPAFAVGGAAQVGPFTVTHCTSSSPCQTYSNQGMSVGVEGVNSNKSSNGAGVEGNATGDGTGVTGIGSGGIGGVFVSSDYIGLEAASFGTVGLQAISETSGPAIQAFGDTGDAIDASTSDANNFAVNVKNTSTTSSGGIIAVGGAIGAVGEANTYPLGSANASGQLTVYTDSTGDVFYDGSLMHEAKTRSGMVVSEYTPTSTAPTIEDNGTAHLVAGMAIVRLDSVFADSIDMSRA